MASFNAAHLAALDSAARQRQRSELMGMNAYDRHKRFVHDLVTYYGGTLPSSDSLERNQEKMNHQGHAPPLSSSSPTTLATSGTHLENSSTTISKVVKTDEDVLKESYRFIRKPEDDEDEDSWSVRLAKKYYSRLFREYCIADLSRYKEGKLGLRWRTQKEVVAGRGQFICGSRGCEEQRGLASFEVPFGYIEAGEKKQALVKVRLCPEHAYQLNYNKNRRAEKRHAAAGKKEKKRKKKEERSRKRKKTSKYSSTDTEDSSSGDTGTDSSSSKGEEEEKEELAHGKKNQKSDHGVASDGYDELFTGLFE